MLSKMPSGHTEKTVWVRKFLHKQKKYLPLIAVLTIAAALVIVVLIGRNHSTSQTANSKNNHVIKIIDNCGPYRSDRIVTVGKNAIAVETTTTLAETQKGLGGRPCIPANRGMLFGFTKSGQYPIWMKGMHFPIDIIWINSRHKVVGAVRNVSPNTYPQTFKNSNPAQYVLELKANRSKELNINAATVINF